MWPCGCQNVGGSFAQVWTFCDCSGRTGIPALPKMSARLSYRQLWPRVMNPERWQVTACMPRGSALMPQSWHVYEVLRNT